MSIVLLQLSLLVVTVIQLTSSQSTYDANDVKSCARTEQETCQLAAVNSQLTTAVSRLHAGISELQRSNDSQLVTAAAELQASMTELQESNFQLVESNAQLVAVVSQLQKANSSQMVTETAQQGETLHVTAVAQLMVAMSQLQNTSSQLVTAVAQLQTSMAQLEAANSQLQKDVAELKTGKQHKAVKGTHESFCR